MTHQSVIAPNILHLAPERFDVFLENICSDRDHDRVTCYVLINSTVVIGTQSGLDYTGLNREMPNGRHQYVTGYITEMNRLKGANQCDTNAASIRIAVLERSRESSTSTLQ